MKIFKFIFTFLPIIAISQNIKTWERTSFEKNGKNEFVRNGYVENFFNKQIFNYDKKGNLLSKKNYDNKDKLIGIVKFDYKKGVKLKRTHKRNPKLKKNLWETFYRYDNKKRIKYEIWYWNKSNRGDSIVYNYNNNLITKFKFTENNSLSKYWIYEVENEKKVKEQGYNKDSTLIKLTKWNRSKGGILITKNVSNLILNDEMEYKYGEQEIIEKINKNGHLFKHFDIRKDKFGNWIELLEYDGTDKLIKKIKRKIEYY